MTLSSSRVYPRTGGETDFMSRISYPFPGLSPHGRGNHIDLVDRLGHLGSIPARAGKPRSSSADRSTSRVYPRTGGETAKAAPLPF